MRIPSFLEVARQSFLLQVQSRIFWLVMALAVANALVFLFMPIHAQAVPGDTLFGMVVSILGFTFFVPVVTLYMAVQAVHGDLEDRTSLYLFTRPIGRTSLLLGKWLAVILLGLFFALVGILALYLVVTQSGRAWRGGRLPDAHMLQCFLLAAGMAVVAYAAMGCLLSALFKRPMLAAAIFVAGWENGVSYTPPEAGVRVATVADPIRRWLLIQLDPPRPLNQFLGAGLQGLEPEKLGDPIVTLGKFTLVVLGLALFVYWRREYDSRPKE